MPRGGTSLLLALAALPLAPLPTPALQEQSAGVAPSGVPAQQDLYQRGLDLLNEGDADGAFAAWEEAWDDLAAQGLFDPRIGVAYVDAVVSRADSARFETATELYMGTLGAPLVDGSRAALEGELERTAVLVGDDERAAWESLADSSDLVLSRELRRYWLERDPTPSTDDNERLLEHWQRIATARQRYVQNRNSIIGTDDRGVIYLRYGEPGRVRSGFLGSSEMELQVRIPQDREARQRIRQYDTNPAYEVWVYDSLNEQGLTFFLFGNIEGSGPFELVDGVHELIPYQARSRASARWTPTGVPVSVYLELFYYEELAKVGGHFGTRFSEMDQLWNEYTYRLDPGGSGGAPSEFEAESLTERYRQQDEFFPPNPPQVGVISELEDRPRDELAAQFIRLLSDDDVPLLAAVGAAAPRLAADRRGIGAAALQIPGFLMRHSLIIRDGDLAEVGRLVQRVRPGRADLSNFVIRHVPEPMHLTLTARTLVLGETSADTLVATDRLPGRAYHQATEPLEASPARFQLSDILTGTMVPPEVDETALPYPVLPSRTIWLQDPLRIYMEFYHMSAGQDGRAVLDTRVRLRPVRRDGEPDMEASPLTLEVQLTPRADRTYREFFDMQLRDQDPGRYQLEVEVTDRVQGTTVVRTVPLELVR